jgi:hypothetical protein
MQFLPLSQISVHSMDRLWLHQLALGEEAFETKITQARQLQRG